MKDSFGWERSPERTEKMRSVLSHRQPGLVVVLENVHDPHNVGAILRTCDAVGVSKVMMVYTIEEPPSLGSTSASGVVKWLDFKRYRSIRQCFDDLHTEGFQILATKIEPKAASLYSYDLSRPTAIVLGNEHRGISDEAAKGADHLLYIPMMGMVESVNVSVATAICLFESMRQRSAKGMYDVSQYSEEALNGSLHEWMKK